MRSDERDDIFTGDLVELEIDSRIWGMAIGFAGSLIYVRHMGGSVGAFHEYELRKMAGRDETDDSSKENLPDNVIPVDFTKSVRLDANTETKGAA